MKKLLIKLSFCSLIIVLFQSSLFGGPGTLKGKLTDAVTGDPLIGGSIQIAGTSFGAATNLEGEYQIFNVSSGTYTVYFRYLGYEAVEMEGVRIEEDQTLTLDVPMSPMAQDLEEVVVSIQARGQMAAINQERAAATVTNVVSSDKIKEVPDVTAAESIGRLPGVSLKRSGGEGSQVVIRGLSPQFSIIEVDGVRMTGTGLDRSVGLSTVSPEMLDGIELSKSLTADKDADAIGGIVNLRTATAQSGFHISALARGGYNGLESTFGDYKFAGSISNRFLDDRFGALLNISNERVTRSSDRFNAGYATTDTIPDPDLNSPTAGEKMFFIQPTNANIEVQKSIRLRTNGNLALDFKNDFMKIRFNNIYSQMTMDNENRNNQFRFNSSDFQMVSNRTDPIEQMRSHSLNGVFRIFTSELDVTYAYTESDYRNNIDEYIIQDRFPLLDDFESIAIPSLYYKLPKDMIEKYFNVGGYGQPSFRNNRRDTIDRQDVTNVVNASWKVPFAISDNVSGKLTAGFKYSGKSRNSDRERLNHAFMAGGIGTDRRNIMYALYPDMITYEDLYGRDETGIPGVNYIDEDYDWGEVLKGDYNLGWGPDQEYLYETHEKYYGLDSDVKLYDPDAINSASEDFETTEKLTAGFVMLELNIGKRIMLLPGLRYELMQTTYSSYYSIQDPFAQDGIKIGYPKPVSVDDRENAHFFPSLNMKIEATDWIDIRAAYYRSTSRPNYSLLSPGIVTDENLENMQAYNPFLDPSTAENYDFGLAFFTSKLGLFSINFFYKEMTDLLYRLPAYQPKWFDQLVVGEGEGEMPASLYESLQKPRVLYPEDFIDPAKNTRMNNYPVNNPNAATIKGIELSWQTNFWYLPGLLRGLVLDLNFSYMESEYEVPYIDFRKELDPSVPFPLYRDVPIYATENTVLQDQPKAIFNARLGYDYKGFSTRLSFRHESERQIGFDAVKNLTDRFIAPLSRFDLNMAQKIGKGFTLTLDVMNITSAMDEQYFRSFNGRTNSYVEYPTGQEHYGMTAQLGLRYNL